MRRLVDSDIVWILQVFRDRWGGDFIVSRGNTHKPEELDGYIALRGGKNAGLITYKIGDNDIEIISLDSFDEHKGIGTALVNAVRGEAVRLKCRRLWLICTNDNLTALQFYQKRGFHLVAVYPNAIDETRKIKPQVPRVGQFGIPLTDELELELTVRINRNSISISYVDCRLQERRLWQKNWCDAMGLFV